MNTLKSGCVALLATICSFHVAAQDVQPAHLEKINGTTRLVRNGEPMLMLSGEFHNSTCSTPEAMRRNIQTAKAMGLNSVIATVSWEQFEPQEGYYDYAQIDHVIKIAEEAQMPIGLIWFASYKNGESSYAPLWVKEDTQKYFRARFADQTNSTTISPMCRRAMEADAKAFAKLMAHIKETDKQRLVCIVQVQNEMGAFMDIDHGKEAQEAFREQVPADIMKYMKEHEATLEKRLLKQWNDHGKKQTGTWTEVFGDTDYTKQLFMAYGFSRYANHIAKAGKAAYDIPMYVNCWMADENWEHHRYPNGGPRSIVMDIYKACAPSIDIISPDIYVDNVRDIFHEYHRTDNPLFIPEIKREAGPAYYAFAETNAMCYAPFGFEETYDDPYFIGEYKTLGELLPTISQYQGTGKMHGFIRQNGVDKPDSQAQLQFGKYTFDVHFIAGEKYAHGLAIQIADNEFIVAGVGCYIEFATRNTEETCKVAYAEEVTWKDNKWSTLFVLNGDETGHHNMLYLRGRMPNPDISYEGKNVPGPLFRPSYQRMHVSAWQNRYKVSGIYRIKLYTYPKK